MTPSSLSARFGAWSRRNSVPISLTAFVGLFMAIYFSPLIFITIPPGHGGVMWWRFFGGTVTGWTFNEGTKIIPPWDKIFLYDLRLQQITLSVDALTSDGLSVNVDVAVRYRLRPSSIGLLHRNIGPDYQQSIVIPVISNQIRNQVAQYTPDALYSQTRETISTNITNSVNVSIEDLSDETSSIGSYVIVDDALVRGVRLPDIVAQAIAQKNVERHQTEQYQYILQRERMESERKQIEAQGIKSFQDIVSAGISSHYLLWKGIDATLKLAESPNAKMVIIGKTDGMPIILGDWAAQQAGRGLETTRPTGAAAWTNPPRPPDMTAERARRQGAAGPEAGMTAADARAPSPDAAPEGKDDLALGTPSPDKPQPLAHQNARFLKDRSAGEQETVSARTNGSEEEGLDASISAPSPDGAAAPAPAPDRVGTGGGAPVPQRRRGP